MAITFRFRYPIARTMAFEREYHPNLRLTLAEKREILKRAITIWMLEDGKLVGETYGVGWEATKDFTDLPRDPDGIYCFSNTILRKYQGGVPWPRFAGLQASLGSCPAGSQPGAEQEIWRSLRAHRKELVQDRRELQVVRLAAGRTSAWADAAPAIGSVTAYSTSRSEAIPPTET